MASPISFTIELSRCWTTDRVMGSILVDMRSCRQKGFWVTIVRRSQVLPPRRKTPQRLYRYLHRLGVERDMTRAFRPGFRLVISRRTESTSQNIRNVPETNRGTPDQKVHYCRSKELPGEVGGMTD